MSAVLNQIRASTARLAARARRRRTSWTATMHDVKFRKGLTPEADVRREVCEFFGATEDDLRGLERAHGAFSSREFQLWVYSFFEGKTASDAALFGAYADAGFYYSLMLGLGCPRYATAFHFMEYLLGRLAGLGRRPVAVDYGSGVGDVALVLAALGFEVHLVDLPDRKSEFALWRLRRRGYHPRFIPATAADPYPALPTPADLVVTIEVWEHLRDPVAALANINAATVPGRSFLLDTNRGFDYETEGDHLAEGIERGRSPAYRRLYEGAWRPVAVDAPDGRLFERVGR